MTVQFHAIAKEWHDKKNGNTYFALRIFNLEGKLLHTIAYQNGYGTAYMDAACEAMGVKMCNNAFGIRQKFDRCLKREVIAWGKPL